MKYKKLDVIYNHIQNVVGNVETDKLPYILYAFNYLMLFDTGMPGILMDYLSTTKNDVHTLEFKQEYEIACITPQEARMLTSQEIDCLNEACVQYMTTEFDTYKDILNFLCPWHVYETKQTKIITPANLNKFVSQRRKLFKTVEID